MATSTEPVKSGFNPKTAGDFWVVHRGGPSAGYKSHLKTFHALVERIRSSTGIVLYDAVEAGVPTILVDVIAGATGQAASNVMDIIGVSPSTFRRKDDANEPLPDVAGHRVMGYLRVAATLRRLLEESGDPQEVSAFNLEAWLSEWMREASPELGGKTPAEMLRNPEGLRAVEQMLERMRGGLPA